MLDEIDALEIKRAEELDPTAFMERGAFDQSAASQTLNGEAEYELAANEATGRFLGKCSQKHNVVGVRIKGKRCCAEHERLIGFCQCGFPSGTAGKYEQTVRCICGRLRIVLGSEPIGDKDLNRVEYRPVGSCNTPITLAEAGPFRNLGEMFINLRRTADQTSGKRSTSLEEVLIFCRKFRDADPGITEVTGFSLDLGMSFNEELPVNRISLGVYTLFRGMAIYNAAQRLAPRHFLQTVFVEAACGDTGYTIPLTRDLALALGSVVNCRVDDFGDERDLNEYLIAVAVETTMEHYKPRDVMAMLKEYDLAEEKEGTDQRHIGFEARHGTHDLPLKGSVRHGKCDCGYTRYLNDRVTDEDLPFACLCGQNDNVARFAEMLQRSHKSSGECGSVVTFESSHRSERQQQLDAFYQLAGAGEVVTLTHYESGDADFAGSPGASGSIEMAGVVALAEGAEGCFREVFGDF